MPGEARAGFVSAVALSFIGYNLVVTAVRNGTGILEAIVWRVAPDGSEITRLADSRKLAGGISEVSVAVAAGGFLTAVRNTSQNFEVINWAFDGGVARRRDTEAGTASRISITPQLFEGGSVASMRNGHGELELIAFNSSNGGVARKGQWYQPGSGDVTETAIAPLSGVGIVTATRRAEFLNVHTWRVSGIWL